jgi:hypothetical protein
MGFFVPKSTKAYRFDTRVAVSLRQHGKKANNWYVLDIRIGPLLAEVLGWKPGDTIEVAWGSSSDFGKLCLRKHPSGANLRKAHGMSKSLSLGSAKLPRAEIMDEHHGRWKLIMQPQRAVAVTSYQLPEGRLGLDLPLTWFEQTKEPKRFALVG